MTTAATTDLAACLALLSDAAPGELTVCDDNEGGDWPPRPLWAFKNPAYDCEDEDTPALHGHITCGAKEDADAIASSVNLLRTHGPTLQRALALLAAVEDGETVGAWKNGSTAPKDGSHFIGYNSVTGPHEFYWDTKGERFVMHAWHSHSGDWFPHLDLWMPLPSWDDAHRALAAMLAAAPAAPGVEG